VKNNPCDDVVPNKSIINICKNKKSNKGGETLFFVGSCAKSSKRSDGVSDSNNEKKSFSAKRDSSNNEKKSISVDKGKKNTFVENTRKTTFASKSSECVDARKLKIGFFVKTNFDDKKKKALRLGTLL
jgi:hypothetical protein